MEDTDTLMKTCNLILATGGGGLVKAAYSSGKPAVGVGPGNCPAIIDETADIRMAVASIIQSNTFDNGVICATENSVVVVSSIYDKVVEEFKNQQAYVVTSESDVKKIGADTVAQLSRVGHRYLFIPVLFACQLLATERIETRN